MSGLNLGGLLGGLIPGVEKGIHSGLQYGLDFARMYVYALEHGSAEEQEALKAVAKQWITEAAGVGGAVVKGDVVKAIENGKDPFATSRHMLQADEIRFGKG